MPRIKSSSCESNGDEGVRFSVHIIDEEETLGAAWKPKMIETTSLIGNETKVINIPGNDSDLRRRIRIDFETTGAAITITSLSLGDECDPNPCKELDVEATCERTGAGSRKCHCSQSGKYRGDQCQSEDFCKETSKNGTKICESKGAVGDFCEPHEVNDREHPFDCLCNSTTDYWDAREQKCERFMDCKRVTSCKVGYKCVDPVSNMSNPCSECDDDYEMIEWNMSTC